MKATAFLPMLILAAICGCTHVNPDKAGPVKLSAAETASLEDTISHDFADPKTVEFRNIRARENYYPDGTKIRSVCGEARGKTALGTDSGFVGFTRNYENGKWVVPVIGQPCY